MSGDPKAWDDDASEIGESQRAASVAFEAERIAALRAVLRSDRELAASYRAIAARVRRRLRANPSADTRRIMLEELRRSLRNRAGLLRESIEDQAERGRSAHAEELRAALGPEPVAQLLASPFDSPAAEIVRGRYAGSPGEPVPLRLANVERDVARRLAIEVREARIAGESAIQAARRFQRTAAAELRQAVPQYIEELVEAVDGVTTKAELRRVVDAFRTRMLRRGSVAGTPFTIRGANRRLLARLRGAVDADVGAAVEEWVGRRLVQRARTIARTEGVRAFHEGYMRTVQESPFVEAIQYNLSSSHPEPDVCDLYAAQAPDGLGAGVYEASGFPLLPAHPHCLCFATSVLKAPDGSSTLLPQDPQSAADWLATQPESARRSILGPTRAEIFREQPRAVVTSRGAIRSVADARRRSA